MLTVALVEDEPLFAELLAENLATVPGIAVRAVFGSGAAATKWPDVTAIDVAVLDIDLGPGPDGLDVARAWRRRHPRLAVVFLSNVRDPAVMVLLAEGSRGGVGYVHKRTAASAEHLVRAIESAARGEARVDPAVLAGLPPTGVGLDVLTPHQQRILKLIATGASNRLIAVQLAVSVKSVENATTGALRALGIDGTDPDVNVRVLASLAYLRLIALAHND